MCGINKKIIFYLYHLLLLTVLVFCWAAVTCSYVYFHEIYEGMTVKEHFRILFMFGSLKHLFFHPLLITVTSITSLLIIWSLKKEKFLPANLLLIFTTAAILYYFDAYLLKEEIFQRSKFIVLSYLYWFVYSAKVLTVFSIQLYVFHATKKALKY